MRCSTTQKLIAKSSNLIYNRYISNTDPDVDDIHCWELFTYYRRSDYRLQLSVTMRSVDDNCDSQMVLFIDGTSKTMDQYSGIKIEFSKSTRDNKAKIIFQIPKKCGFTDVKIIYRQYKSNNFHSTGIAVRLAGGLMSTTAFILFVIGIACCAVKRRNRLNNNIYVASRPIPQTTTISTPNQASIIANQPVVPPYSQQIIQSPPSYEQTMQPPPYPADGISPCDPPPYSGPNSEKKDLTT